MSELNIRQELAALREAALEDLLETSNADLRREAIEDGDDIKAIASNLKGSMREAAAGALRNRMALSKARMHSPLATPTKGFVRPAVDRIKAIVSDLMQRDPSVGFAFRDGKKQTESDWQTIYDDLLAMGLIKSEDDGA